MFLIRFPHSRRTSFEIGLQELRRGAEVGAVSPAPGRRPRCYLSGMRAWFLVVTALAAAGIVAAAATSGPASCEPRYHRWSAGQEFVGGPLTPSEASILNAAEQFRLVSLGESDRC